jgi:hypothetical protein
VMRSSGGTSMRKYITAGVLLVATISIAFAQTTSPLSIDNRANVTPQTHCKDKAGHVWLKSSAELAGKTDASTTGGTTPTVPSSGSSTPVGSAGGPNMTEVARTLPDCP